MFPTVAVGHPFGFVAGSPNMSRKREGMMARAFARAAPDLRRSVQHVHDPSLLIERREGELQPLKKAVRQAVDGSALLDAQPQYSWLLAFQHPK
jgi:hypothetical protein